MKAPLLQGFSVRWEEHPHRVRALGVDLRADRLGLRCEGGTWANGRFRADRVRWRASAATLAGPGVAALTGSTPLRLEGGWRPGERRPAEAAGQVELELSPALAACEAVGVVLRGFELEADGRHPPGYTTRSLGAGLREVRREGARLRFAPWLRFEAGPVPDRLQRLGDYGSRGEVRWTVVGLARGALSAAHHASLIQGAAGLSPARPRGDHQTRSLRLSGARGLPLAVPALRGFRIELNPHASGPWPAGRYLRELEVGVATRRYEPALGRAELDLEGHFSNAGQVSWATSVEASLDVVLLQTEGATLRQAHPAGLLDGARDEVVAL